MNSKWKKKKKHQIRDSNFYYTEICVNLCLGLGDCSMGMNMMGVDKYGVIVTVGVA